MPSTSLAKNNENNYTNNENDQRRPEVIKLTIQITVTVLRL